MSAMGQRQTPTSAIGIALALSLLVHLPLLLLWHEIDPVLPVLAGNRVQLQLSSPLREPAAAETAAAPRQPGETVQQSAPQQAKSAPTLDVATRPVPPPDRSAVVPAGLSAPAADPLPATAQPESPQPLAPTGTAAVPSPTPNVSELAAQTDPATQKPDEPDHTGLVSKQSPDAAEIDDSGRSSRQQLEQALARALLDHFSYPLKARRRHWEGQVVLRVTILRDGQIGTAHVDKSSGHRLLDQAALKSLRQVPSLHGFTLKQDVDLLLPVIYQLRS